MGSELPQHFFWQFYAKLWITCSREGQLLTLASACISLYSFNIFKVIFASAKVAEQLFFFFLWIGCENSLFISSHKWAPDPVKIQRRPDMAETCSCTTLKLKWDWGLNTSITQLRTSLGRNSFCLNRDPDQQCTSKHVTVSCPIIYGRKADAYTDKKIGCRI